MNNLRGEQHYDLHKQYRQRYEQRAEQFHQADKVQKKQSRKSVNILRVISQILVNTQ